MFSENEEKPYFALTGRRWTGYTILGEILTFDAISLEEKKLRENYE